MSSRQSANRRRAAIVALGVLVGLSWAGLPSASIAADPHATSATQTPASDPQEDALANWNQFVASQGGLGTYRDDSAGEMVAVMAPSSRGATAEVAASSVLERAVTLGIDARIVVATISRSTIDAITADLVGIRRSIPAEYSYVFRFDPRLQVVTLESDAPEEDFSALLAEYPGFLEYSAGGIVLQSRISDSPPHWGGAAVRSGTRFCTSGFAVKTSGGAKRMTTAGHCFAEGASVTNYKWNGTQWVGGGFSFGSVSSVSGDYDVELMSGSTYAGHIYVGENTQMAVLGAADPSVGYTYCVSGVYGGKHCNHTLISNNTFLCTYVCFNALEFSGGTSGGAVTQGGDSGAPWYSASASGIRGSHVGVNQGCNTTTGANCRMYAVAWSKVAATFNVSIVTD